MSGEAEASEAAVSTQSLVERAQAGDRNAADRLLRRCSEHVRQTARMLLGRSLRGYLDSDDVLQEALTAAFLDLGRFEYRDETSLVRWLSTIVVNKVRGLADYHFAAKRDRREDVALGRDSGDGADGLAARRTTPGDAAEGREREALVRRCIEDLPDAYREVIVLVTYLGTPWDVAAERLGRSVGAARMLHVRAQAELGRRLRELGWPG